MAPTQAPKQKDNIITRNLQGKKFVFKCPNCGIPLKRSKEKFDKENFGVAKLTCEKCGKVFYDFMIPNEVFFGPPEAE